MPMVMVITKQHPPSTAVIGAPIRLHADRSVTA
jgi:hypothetical protein